jgi:transposase
VAVSREHRRAKTDRLDTELLKRAYLGWLRGEPHHCSMATVPTLDERDAKRPTRERENLVGERTRVVSRMRGCLARFGIRGFKPTLRRAPERLAELRTPEGAALPPHALAELRRDLARLRLITDQIKEVGGARAERIEPDESGARRREKGLAKAGKARVRRGMIQLAWRFLRFQETSALAQWHRARTADARGGTRKTLIVALARKLLIALWRLATTGEVPAGVTLRPQVGTASA